uniref:Uncharacterized protein n=1 Tax=Taeniopygia guttata TaxID=59729 RepID=A0A674H3L5_TAEGU
GKANTAQPAWHSQPGQASMARPTRQSGAGKASLAQPAGHSQQGKASTAQPAQPGQQGTDSLAQPAGHSQPGTASTARPTRQSRAGKPAWHSEQGTASLAQAAQPGQHSTASRAKPARHRQPGTASRAQPAWHSQHSQASRAKPARHSQPGTASPARPAPSPGPAPLPRPGRAVWQPLLSRGSPSEHGTIAGQHCSPRPGCSAANLGDLCDANLETTCPSVGLWKEPKVSQRHQPRLTCAHCPKKHLHAHLLSCSHSSPLLLTLFLCVLETPLTLRSVRITQHLHSMLLFIP